MAKTSANKSKAWRKVAEHINEDAGMRHQGRKYKMVNAGNIMGKRPHELVMQLMAGADLLVKPKLEEVAPESSTPEPVTEVNEHVEEGVLV